MRFDQPSNGLLVAVLEPQDPGRVHEHLRPTQIRRRRTDRRLDRAEIAHVDAVGPGGPARLADLARRPSRRSRAATSSTATFAPSAAKRRAVARPSPDPAPGDQHDPVREARFHAASCPLI